MSDKNSVEAGILSPKLFSIYINDSCHSPQRKKNTLVYRRHRPFVFDSHSATTMGRIVKGVKERFL
jgi:hypothetical protein